MTLEPEATRRAFTDDGYYRSGDLGRTQADGRFVFLTRMGDSLRLAGFLVSPAEIEQSAPPVDHVDNARMRELRRSQAASFVAASAAG